MIPRIYPSALRKYANLAHKTTIEDDGETISLYIYPLEQQPNRFVCETESLSVIHACADMNNKGNVQGIEIILKRSVPVPD